MSVIEIIGKFGIWRWAPSGGPDKEICSRRWKARPEL